MLAVNLANRNLNANKLVALLRFDGADAATTTTDDGPSAHTVTLANSAQLDNAQVKFGPTSCLFINASQSYCRLPASSNWDFGTGDFTVRFWARKSANGSNGSYRRLFQTVMGDVVCSVSLADNRVTNGQLSWSVSTNGVTQNVAADASVGTWALDSTEQFSIEQHSGTLRLYKSGTVVHTSVPGAALYFNAAYTPTLGGQTGVNRTLAGWIDEFEVYKGVALAGGATSYQVPTIPSTQF